MNIIRKIVGLIFIIPSGIYGIWLMGYYIVAIFKVAYTDMGMIEFFLKFFILTIMIPIYPIYKLIAIHRLDLLFGIIVYPSICFIFTSIGYYIFIFSDKNRLK